MDNNNQSLEKIVGLAKRRGFIFPGSDIYGGLKGVWDYGPMGMILKQKLVDLWKDFFVFSQPNMFMIDSAILMNQKVWQASGHTETFTDPLVECYQCHSRFRADKIDLSNCPNCKNKNSFNEPKNFNLMFKTFVGPIAQDDQIISIPKNDLLRLIESQDSNLIKLKLGDFVLEENPNISYLRPETAQGIFTNYKNIIDVFYPDIPFGIAQYGKAFRNEISPRDFIFRSREFEQLEIEYFINPKDWQEEFDNWIVKIKDWYRFIQLNEKSIHLLEVDKKDLAHYSKRTIDFEFDFPIGKEELNGLAYRTDFDLKNIAKFSNKNLEYRNKKDNQTFLPHVIEPSFGVDRMIMAILSQAYTEEILPDGSQRTLLKLSKKLAPVLIMVSPLLKNHQDLVDLSRSIYQDLKTKFKFVQYDDNSNIGKRYRRADEIGTPYCITVDFQSLKDQTVTVRDRDTLQQTRLSLKDLDSFLMI